MEGNGVNLFRRFEDLYLGWVQRGIEKEHARNAELRANVDKLPEPLKELRPELGTKSLLLDRGGGRLIIAGTIWVFVGAVISSAAHLSANGQMLVIVIPFLLAYFAAILHLRAARKCTRKWNDALNTAKLESVPLYEHISEVV